MRTRLWPSPWNIQVCHYAHHRHTLHKEHSNVVWYGSLDSNHTWLWHVSSTTAVASHQVQLWSGCLIPWWRMSAALSRALDCYLEMTYPSLEVWNLEEREERDFQFLLCLGLQWWTNHWHNSQAIQIRFSLYNAKCSEHIVEFVVVGYEWTVMLV